MMTPKRINVGDKVGFLSTARKISLSELKPALEILDSWGLKVVFGKHLFEQDNQFAGTIAQRAADLQNMLDNDEIKAVFFVRGGYGTVQIVDKVNFFKLYQNPKWLIGYSDITVIHAHLNSRNFTTLHATMPINFSKNTKKSLESLQNIIFGGRNIIKVPAHKFNRYGSVEAEIIGGNLSVLYSLLGSDSDIQTAGKILFIEDVDEYLYHVDRMVINMQRNNKFSSLKGMIVGGMTSMNDNKICFGKTAEEIILEYE